VAPPGWGVARFEDRGWGSVLTPVWQEAGGRSSGTAGERNSAGRPGVNVSRKIQGSRRTVPVRSLGFLSNIRRTAVTIYHSNAVGDFRIEE